ncbi:15901_t:CDS:1, partial [Dentiscutata heterogama]
IDFENGGLNYTSVEAIIIDKLVGCFQNKRLRQSFPEPEPMSIYLLKFFVNDAFLRRDRRII